MLTQHQFYVYHQDEKVFARRGTEKPVLAKKCKTPAQAYELVQSVVNPENRSADSYGDKGFLSDEFQNQISPNCEKFVTEAYAAAS